MKLKNKLLPFVGVAALGATFAPIALTSCKSNTSIEGAIDLREWYSPTIEKHAYDILTEEEVSNLYFCGAKDADWGDWIDEDEMNERLTQDYLFGSSMYVQYLSETGVLEADLEDAMAYLHNVPEDVAEAYFYNLSGFEDVLTMEAAAAAEAKDVQIEKLEYQKYDVSISDVRIAHMTDYSSLISEEYPTISFELEFDVEYEGDIPENIKIDMTRKNGRKESLGGAEIHQTHKGNISVVNVPIKIGFNERKELDDSYSWSLMFDYERIANTELSTRVPFAIYGTDNVTNVVEAKVDGRDHHQESTRVYDFDYYSNMDWRKLVSENTIDYAEGEAEDASDAAIEAARAAGITDPETLEAIGEAAYEATFKEIIVKRGAINLFDGLNASFFDTLSYYLLSIERKM